ncbi:PAS domain S-box-containing protein [Maridesulfovibrio ferrireducens]|uniref:histidine kinase n=1 Tax=Maridesulfovibrio ferrireducens TaxID=246191 RepID=A0A1G9LHH6_9BACT|nr:PAS domain-containing hybrid sensor histidine kinase/response regulator [Maridesulfovibrio ferrireducens]SDL61409.1 PAS domain S-box-containing protein [Maridesulfovibrio ferrireducens]
MSIRIQEQILLDLAMAFGNSLDLKEVLSEGMSVYLRRLGCMSGVVFMEKENSQESLRHEIVSVIPSLGQTHKAISSFVDMIMVCSNRKELDEVRLSLPLHKVVDNRHAYLFNLPGFGFVALLKSGEPFKDSLIKSLLPLNTKIANVCLSCVSYQRYAELNAELHREVAERKQAVQELGANERRLRVIFEHSPLGMIHFDADGLIVNCNNQFVHLMGSTREKLLGFNTARDSSPEMGVALTKALSGEPSCYEDFYTSVTGGKRGYLRAVFNPVTPEKESSEVIAIVEDFSKRKQVEESLLQSEARLSTILSSIQAGVILIDPQTRIITDSNEEACRLIGLDREQIIGRVCHDFICAADKEQCPVLDLGQEVDKSERILVTATGKNLTIQKTVSTVVIDGKEQLLECFVDITSRKQAEKQLLQAKEDIEQYVISLETTNKQLIETTASRDELEQEVADRKLAERRLRESTQLYEELVENAASIILRLDQVGRVTFFNEFAEKLFGYSRDEILGECIVGTIVPEMESSGRDLRKMINSLFDKPEDFMINENENMLKDGSRIWVNWSNKALYGPDNELIEILCIGSDITERKRAEKTLKLAKQQAEAANKAKSEFLANMSHEIRTPMNSILGVADLLTETELTEEQSRYIALFESAGKSLLSLINEILDLSKVETGRMELESLFFDLTDAVKEVDSIMAIAAKSKGLEFSCTMEPDSPKFILGDQIRLKQILLNIMGNAVKFTEHGSVSINISSIPARDNSRLFRFSISDTGIGVPQEKLQTIFDSFAQADSSTTRKYGGTGLGLAIAKRLAELMDGEILVESEVGRGTTFHFVAPFETCYEIDQGVCFKEEKFHFVNSGAGKKRILVVEDSESNRMLIDFYLEQSEHEVVLVENGLEGLNAYKKDDFDIVFMDIQMPVMDGIAATKAIRDYEKEHLFDPKPIVALTANAFKEDRQRCFNAGCSSFLAKPIKKNDLLMIIDSF